MARLLEFGILEFRCFEGTGTHQPFSRQASSRSTNPELAAALVRATRTTPGPRGRSRIPGLGPAGVNASTTVSPGYDSGGREYREPRDP